MSDLIQTEYGLMAKHLSSDKLGNLCTDENGIITGPFGSQLHKSDYVDIGTPILTVEHLVDNRISRNNLPCVCDTDRDRLSRYQAVTGDVIVSRVGSVDRRALIRESECGWLFSGRCLRIRVNRSLLSPEYLSWFLGFDGYKQYIRKIAVGATMPSLNTDILRNLDVYFPPLHEQKAIAHILGSLDDKIDQLRKTNTVLEDMASALFKSWFVDFDPVKAKQENRPTGLPKDLDDLFPDSFEDSALGPIPTGWRVGCVGDVTINVQKSISSNNLTSDMNYVALEHMPRKCLQLHDWGNAGEVASNKSSFQAGDILFGKLRPYFHKVVIAPVDGVCSTDILVTRPTESDWHSFVTMHMFSDELVKYSDSTSNGTRMPRTSWNVIKGFPICIPPMSIARQFNMMVAPSWKRASGNIHQIRTLTNLRDTLLPKLISGELRVPDAEQMVAELGL